MWRILQEPDGDQGGVQLQRVCGFLQMLWELSLSLPLLGGLSSFALIGFDWMTALKAPSGKGLAHRPAYLRGMGSNWPNSSDPFFILSGPPNALFHHLLALLSLGMIYPQLMQPPNPQGLLLTSPLLLPHNLLCHTDPLSPNRSKQTTTHGWSQDVSCVPAQFALTWRKSIGLTARGQLLPLPSSSRPPALPAPSKRAPVETCWKKKQQA